MAHNCRAAATSNVHKLLIATTKSTGHPEKPVRPPVDTWTSKTKFKFKLLSFCTDWWRCNYLWIERNFSHLRGWTSGILKQTAAKSCSLDPVPASLLRYCIDDLLPIIKRVVNLSFNSTSMPSSMKNALLSPLLKKPSLDFKIFSNFRTVSNLKFLSKGYCKSGNHASDGLFVW